MRAVVALLFAAASLGACTLITSFNPEGQPCDLSATAGSQCLGEYHCENRKCVPGKPDGGP